MFTCRNTLLTQLLAQEKGLLADSDIEEDFEIELQEKDFQDLSTSFNHWSLIFLCGYFVPRSWLKTENCWWVSGARLPSGSNDQGRSSTLAHPGGGTKSEISETILWNRSRNHHKRLPYHFLVYHQSQTHFEPFFWVFTWRCWLVTRWSKSRTAAWRAPPPRRRLWPRSGGRPARPCSRACWMPFPKTWADHGRTVTKGWRNWETGKTYLVYLLVCCFELNGKLALGSTPASGRAATTDGWG